MTQTEAIIYCEKRWHFLIEKYPTMLKEIPLSLYLRANLRATMKLRPDCELAPDELSVRKRALGD